MQSCCILKVEQAVIDQRQIERSLDDCRRESHKVRDQVLLNAERCRLDQVLLRITEEHVKVAENHLVYEG